MDRWVASILWLLLAMPSFGAGKKWTQAENMGFAGPVKAASTACQTFMQQPAQPDGQAIIYQHTCGEHEFDKDGNEVRSGWVENGQFRGSVEHRILDGRGRVQEETWENEKGEVTSRNVYTNGPEGEVQIETYINGKLSSTATYRYDGQGHVVESSTHKPDGTLEYHHWSTFDERGNELESVDEGPGDTYYDVIQTYNPKTGHLETFTSLNRDGSMRLWYRVNNDLSLSFWQQPGDKRTYGSGIYFDNDNGIERDCREYKWDGTYTTTHYTFTDKSKRYPVKAALYDTDHQLVLEADYDYEMDAFGNWTKRTIWVQTQESGERQLLEKDARTLTYYPAEYPQSDPRH
jgi:antitoxin component YwqK of YwqJK toxin-antitoxin module